MRLQLNERDWLCGNRSGYVRLHLLAHPQEEHSMARWVCGVVLTLLSKPGRLTSELRLCCVPYPSAVAVPPASPGTKIGGCAASRARGRCMRLLGSLLFVAPRDDSGAAGGRNSDLLLPTGTAPRSVSRHPQSVVAASVALCACERPCLHSGPAAHRYSALQCRANQ